MNDPLTLSALQDAVKSGAAFRRLIRLQPAGGPGDKVFPPTYEGGQYALEERVIDGQRLPCVLLDSVQSQANRMELALRDACYHGKDKEAEIPVVTVDFDAAGLSEIGEITSLDAPHRLADAILRDSMNNGQKFRDSAEGKLLNNASLAKATGLYEICPTALIFGLWDSAGPRGGLGTKFQRVLVGEIVGVNIATGVKPSSRIDPLGIEKAGADIFEAADGSGWTLDPSLAKKANGKPVKFGKDGKPSEINHGNVTPSLKNKDGQLHHGGATLAYAQQSVVISLPALRRLRFPDDANAVSDARNLAARTALAALAIAAADLSIQQGCDLRSRCLLVPDAEHPATWEIVSADGQAKAVTVTDAKALLVEASVVAVKAGLPVWKRLPLKLKPSEGLATLVKKSRELAASAPVEG